MKLILSIFKFIKFFTNTFVCVSKKLLSSKEEKAST